MGYAVGLTGGIGCGKSTVTTIFSQLGISVVDTDLIARQVVEPGSTALIAIAAHFGQAILQTNGELDRAALRQRVFANASERLWLESLLHPLIRQQTQSQLTQCEGPYCLLVSPLLLETDQRALVEKVIVVDVPLALQIERTVQRDNNNESQVRAIIATQIDRESRLAAADFIIDNSTHRNALDSQIERIDQQLRDLAQHAAK